MSGKIYQYSPSVWYKRLYNLFPRSTPSSSKEWKCHQLLRRARLSGILITIMLPRSALPAFDHLETRSVEDTLKQLIEQQIHPYGSDASRAQEHRLERALLRSYR